MIINSTFAIITDNLLKRFCEEYATELDVLFNGEKVIRCFSVVEKICVTLKLI